MLYTGLWTRWPRPEVWNVLPRLAPSSRGTVAALNSRAPCQGSAFFHFERNMAERTLAGKDKFAWTMPMYLKWPADMVFEQTTVLDGWVHLVWPLASPFRP